jgi:hypothetical protein
MFDRDHMKRTTFSASRQYFIRAEARWAKPSFGPARIVVKAEVFEGSPTIVGNENIFLHKAQAATSDLLDALQSAEAIARQYIDSLATSSF